MPTVAITGAAGAIGSVTSAVFADAGWDLALLDYGEDNRAALLEQHPDALAIDANLMDPDSAQAAFDEVAASLDTLDAVLCIAGGFSMQAIVDATDDDYERMLGLNLKTLFHSARAALPHLTAQDAGGFLLGVSAPAAEDGGAGAALYAASKAAVAAFVKSVDAEHRADGVRASVLYPMGVVDTEANREAMQDADPNTWIAPQELAEGMLHLATRSPRGHIPELKVHAVLSDS